MVVSASSDWHLPTANLLLFVLQTAIVIGVYYFAPEKSWPSVTGHDSNIVPSSGATDGSGSPPSAKFTASTLEPKNPLAPPPYVFTIWMLIYTFTAMTVITDRFYPTFSFYYTSDDPKFLRQWFQLACLASTFWVVLELWLKWLHMATFALIVLWSTMLPLYLFVVRHPTLRHSQAWVYYFCSEFSIRLYFGWLSADVIFSIAGVLQELHGAFFGFGVYASLLGALLVLMFSTYVHGHDPVVGLVVTWVLFGLIFKQSSYPGDTQEVFNELRAVAVVVAPVFPVLVFIDSVRYVYTAHWQASRILRGSNEFKSFMYETTSEYGTV
ncbi:hypothetical protein CCR75_009364 [Bremia lactucae]|uniref:Uncharacterized protein n=1 Tax=Bremia lactucae TaxID=4779 RepID=A0A976FIH8_BRELC|nr:hypothetical protein CCR75_009364 [Bremia lactucae]